MRVGLLCHWRYEQVGVASPRFIESGSPPPMSDYCETQTIHGLRPAGNLQMPQFDPVEWVFACPKTISSGTKLGAL